MANVTDEAMKVEEQSTSTEPMDTDVTTKKPEEVSKLVQEVGKEADQAKQPGEEHKMKVQPQFIKDTYKGSGKLSGKVCLITGGDSGIGRAIAVHYAREGAKGIVIVYKDEHEDAKQTSELVQSEGCPSCLCIPGDIGDSSFCNRVVEQTVQEMGSLDVLVNNAAEQHARESVTDISTDQLHNTFKTNMFSMFYLCRAAVQHMKEGSCIINNTSVTAYKGEKELLDYSTTKGGIVAFTRSMSEQLIAKGIRVNAVAPGPIWTPLIPATFGEESAEKFGGSSSMGRAGQPSEVATSFVFLGSNLCSSYITGQVLHPNGGTVLNV